MSSPVTLAIVMPVYNEEAIIGQVLGAWTRELDRLDIAYELHAYNDGSTDGTLGRLRLFAAACSKVVVHDKPNSGHGATILLGYREQSDKEWIFQVDSDDETGPEEFAHLWRNRERYDLLIGRREGRQTPLPRRVMTFASRTLVRVCYGPGITDVNCPYRLMRRDVFRPFFHGIPDHVFAPNVILSGLAVRDRFHILEAPVACRPRRTGTTTIRGLRVLRIAPSSFWQTLCLRTLRPAPDPFPPSEFTAID
ncbi:MAG: glycosyltransferase family 2 protein [bacterium]